ncbi:hypothetical protein SAMN05444851_2861 [Aliiroseovarius sediminilitoris]|uniref:Uncharacterized protein n=1 Tax=Aliiroseovarius sediminilitoris TaxID=1173584 RepID=A0A1I0QS77_9RHOB|nr:hypothetical protein [Aliiroseovarius sediminilitoris]SEW30247.1 hypothetical protein SAMN05444851_2861 [Aliiroseovarius sediminilitoris]
MVILIATPSILVPGVSQESGQIVTIVALFAAALTIFEYASTYPGLVEFRDAPPFNRIRFAALFVTVFSLSVIVRGQTDHSTATQFMTSVGMLIGQAIDFPYSPVRFVVSMLPDTASFNDMALLRAAAGMSYLISLLSMAVFLMALRFTEWPSKSTGAFNVWVNLPTFDPTTGGDVVRRLVRDARFNIALGFLLPFATPIIITAAVSLFGSVSVENHQTMIWTVAAWAFLPASLFMRGIAMLRVALMINSERKRNKRRAGDGGLAHA